MTRFNQSTMGQDKTTNYEGAVAYKLDPKTELYTAVCCASLQPKFYQPNEKDQITQIRNLILQAPPEFVAKLAVYVREKMYLRSVPLVLAVELAKIHKGDNLVSRMTERVIQRADELTEVLAYYQAANSRTGTKKLDKLSKQLQLGLARAFDKFDTYQFAKYNRQTEIKLRDALFLAHPKPKDKERENLYKQIADDALPVPYTWEVELSRAGQEGKTKKEVWENLIGSSRLGYMALLRNLRNLLEADISAKYLEMVYGILIKPEAVAKSKQLPFRFFSAYQIINGCGHPRAGYLMEALEKAVQLSARNLRGFDLDTVVLIACDVSASMQRGISPKSAVQFYDIGLMLGMTLQYSCAAVISGMFGSTWKVIQMPRTQILQNALEFRRREGEVGYSTNGYLIIDWLIQERRIVDKVMVFTDCQMWDSCGWDRSFVDTWHQYKRIAPGAKLYLFDLAGYGTIPVSIRENGVYLIAGWSEKVFDILAAIEQGSSAVKEIDKIEL